MCAQMKVRCDGPLSLSNELATCLLAYPQHMYVKTIPGHRSEADDKLRLRARNRDKRHVAVPLRCVQRRRRGRCAWRGTNEVSGA